MTLCAWAGPWQRPSSSHPDRTPLRPLPSRALPRWADCRSPPSTVLLCRRQTPLGPPTSSSSAWSDGARASSPPSSTWHRPHRTPTIPSSLLPQCCAMAKGRRRPRHSLFSRAPHRRPKSTPPSDELVEPVPGCQNPSSVLDFVQPTPSTASTGESHPEPLHPRLATPLLSPYSSSRCSAHRSGTPFLRTPPPPRIAATSGLLRRLHATPPSR
jgi:hypothetical protein